MPNCVNPECRRAIDESFDFCPACGMDNRAPEQRGRVLVHEHLFPKPNGRCCVICGLDSWNPTKPLIRPRAPRQSRPRQCAKAPRPKRKENWDHLWSDADNSWLGIVGLLFEVLTWVSC